MHNNQSIVSKRQSRQIFQNQFSPLNKQPIKMLSRASLCLLTLALVFSAACGQDYLVGGLHKDEQPADGKIQLILQKVYNDIGKMAKKDYASIEPISYRKQVVAGSNYYIKALATTTDGVQSYIHVSIYEPIKRPTQLTGVLLNQDKNKRIESF